MANSNLLEIDPTILYTFYQRNSKNSDCGLIQNKFRNVIEFRRKDPLQSRFSLKKLF